MKKSWKDMEELRKIYQLEYYNKICSKCSLERRKERECRGELYGLLPYCEHMDDAIDARKIMKELFYINEKERIAEQTDR